MLLPTFSFSGLIRRVRAQEEIGEGIFATEEEEDEPEGTEYSRCAVMSGCRKHLAREYQKGSVPGLAVWLVALEHKRMQSKYEVPKAYWERVSWRIAFLIIAGVAGLFFAMSTYADFIARGKDQELKHVLRAARASQDVVSRFGAVESVAVAKCPYPGWKRRRRDEWTRTRVLDGAKGAVGLELNGEKNWGTITIEYRYRISSGQFDVIRISFGQMEPREAHHRKILESMSPELRRALELR